MLERAYNKLISELIDDCIARQAIESILIFYRPLCMKKDKTFVLRDKEHIYSQSGLHILVYCIAPNPLVYGYYIGGREQQSV